MPKKTFIPGEVLTAANVNTFLMDQSVMTFADSAARESAIGTPTEGMISYLNNNNSLEVYTGSAWNTFNPQSGNAVINGAFDIWQRATSFTVGAAFPYTADRWQVIRGGVVAGMTISRQLTSDSTNLPDIQYAARVQRDSGNTSTQFLQINQSFETVNSIPLSGKAVTLSFYARAGANFSSASSVLQSLFTTGLSTDANVVTAGFGAGQATVTTNHTLTTTWQRFQVTVNVANTTTQFAMRFQNTPVGTAGANDWFEITGVQLEAGSVATPFRRNANSLQGELAACQRYYWRNAPGTVYGTHASGSPVSSTQGYFLVNLPVTMRTIPTSIEYANIAVQIGGGTVTPVTNLTADQAAQNTFRLLATVTAMTSTSLSGFLINNNNATGFIGFNAEL
jgi:hypothetical protein